jgi:hypothetical protein
MLSSVKRPAPVRARVEGLPVADSEVPMTPAHIWREMTAEQRLAAAGALWEDGDSAPQLAEAVHAIARQLKFRPQSVLNLPAEKRARHLASLRIVSESIASRALVVYHLATKRPMLAAFLDALAIPHEDGLIAEGARDAPDAARLREAAAALLAQFPPADVRTYFLTLAVQDPDTWGALGPIALELIPS